MWDTQTIFKRFILNIILLSNDFKVNKTQSTKQILLNKKHKDITENFNET